MKQKVQGYTQGRIDGATGKIGSNKKAFQGGREVSYYDDVCYYYY